MEKRFNKSIDVIICCYKENFNIIKETILAATKINYDNYKIYVADDNNNQLVKDLCSDIGITYICRKINTFGKSGNLNNALKYMSSEFVIVLDADQKVTTNIITTLTSYLKPGIDMITAPQIFDDLTKNDRFQNSYHWFFFSLQKILSKRGNCFCVGTNYVVRRKALEKINYYVKGYITEDVQTGINLLKNGNIVFCPEIVATGKSPQTLNESINLHCRWTLGSFKFAVNSIVSKNIFQMNFKQNIILILISLFFFQPLLWILNIIYSKKILNKKLNFCIRKILIIFTLKLNLFRTLITEIYFYSYYQILFSFNYVFRNKTLYQKRNNKKHILFPMITMYFTYRYNYSIANMAYLSIIYIELFTKFNFNNYLKILIIFNTSLI